MQYLHVKNLEKYHPSYKDRSLIWCKVYFSMITSDPEFEMIGEIDKWRFICFIILELQSKKPIPLDPAYLQRKGFNLKKRPISLTLKMLHAFIEVCTTGVTQSRVDKSRVDKSRVDIEEEAPSALTHSVFKDDRIQPLWKAWLEVRKKMKVPNIAHSLVLAADKLQKLGEDKAVEALEQAVEKGWRGIYAPKDTKPTQNMERAL